MSQIRTEANRLFAELAKHARSPEYKRRLTTKGVAALTELEHAMSLLILFASNRATDSTLCERDRCQLNRAAERTRRVMSRLKEGLDQSDAAKIYWLELDAKGRARLRAKLLDVSSLLRAELFERCASVTLTSATLTTSGSFEFIRGQLGVPNDALETIAPSPFDFESQALLVVPEGISDPRTPEFVDAAAEAFRRVIELCDGRTLGLFTSYRNLNAVYDRLRGTRYRILRQGDLPRAELARVFKEDVGSVLLGTDSFWTGIDVPGESLTALVIDKLPFPSPDDPVIDAICERDPQAFNNYLVPLAIIALRQGVGRLIRCKNDFGVVVILDPRIAAKSYGRKFLASLPPMLTTRRIDNIARFLTEARHAHAC